MTTRIKPPFALTVAIVVLTMLPLRPVSAQEVPAPGSNEPSTSQSVYEDYYGTAQALQDEHTAKLAEIDRRHREALREYREENIRRAQALPAQNTAAHKDLASQGLSGAERQAEFNRIQAEHNQNRKEYGQWRDSTSQKLRDEYASARAAQNKSYQLKRDQLLAERNANLARLRVPVGGGVAGASANGGATGSVGAGVAGASTAGLGAAGEIGTGRSESTDGGSGINTARDPAPADAGDTGVGETVAGTNSSAVDTPQRDDSGEYFEYEDGSLVRAVGPDGEVGQVNDKGDIVYGDGTTIVHTGDREITIHKPDGSSSTQQIDGGGKWKPTGSRSAADYPMGSDVDAPVRNDSGDSFVYDDGATVRAFGPEGDLGKINDKGDVVFADGTTIVHTGDRQITIHRPNGSSRTQRADENGQWQPVKPHNEGTGSNDKYASTSGGGGGSSGGSSGGASGGSGGGGSGSGKTQSGPRGASGSSSSGGSGSSGGSSGGNDSSSGNDSDDSSSGNDSGDSGSADGGSGGSESSESGEDADSEGKGKEYYGENGSGRRSGPSDLIQGIVDRATGQSTDPETGVPEPCSESGGFGVTQPGPGGSGKCVPGHLPTVSEDNDQQPDTPDVGESVDAEDMRRAAGSGIAGRITQPGIGEDGIPVEDLPSQSALDRSPVVNPPEN